MYEGIMDETMFISRASEGSVSMDYILNQPVFIRKKYLKQFQDEVEERKDKLEKQKMKQHK